MAFAILSLTEPPTDKHSSLPTREETDVYASERQARSWQGYTEVTSKTLFSGDPVQSDEGGIAHSVEGTA